MAPKVDPNQQKMILRQLHISRIKELKDIAEKARTDENLKSLFEIRYKFLTETYREFEKVHLLILQNTIADEIENQDLIRKDIDDAYYFIQHVYSQLFASSLEVVQTKNESKPPSPTSSKVRLPKLSLPSWEGDLKSYESFIDIFTSLVHTNKELNDIDKFQYLILSLKGEPLTLIKSIPLTSNNYVLAFETLKNRYSNPRIQASVHYSALKNYPALRSENPAELRKLIDCFSENISILEKLGLPIKHWDFILVDFLLEKIDMNTRKRFELHASSNEIPSFNHLKDFLLKQCTALDSIAINKSTSTSKPFEKKQFEHKFNNSKTTLVTNETNDSSSCLLCKGSHLLYKCPTFSSKTPIERFQFVKRNSLCINCLRANCRVQNCKSTSTCRTCNSKHHTLLHREQTVFTNSDLQTKTNDSDVRNKSQTANSLTSCSAQVTSKILLGTVLLELRDKHGNFRQVRALLDTASQSSFISKNCLRRFGLKPFKSSPSILGIGKSCPSSSGSVRLTIRPRNESSITYDLEAIVLQPICGNMPNFVVKDTANWTHLNNLKLADPDFLVTREIDLLIGAELYPYVLREGSIIPENKNIPAAINTQFGFVVCGKISEYSEFDRGPIHSFCVSVNLEHTIRKFWESEKLPEKSYISPDDAQCERIYSENVYRKTSGRYVVPLPLKNLEPLGNSYQIAKNRLISLEKRLDLESNIDHKLAYNEFMEDYLAQGHMKLVDVNKQSSNPVYYIPHTFVVRPDSQTTKLRVVFDASTRTDKGISLNDRQFVGPKLQQDICQILLHFREHFVVLTADIKQMFRNIDLAPEYHDLQRILWRFSSEEVIREYQLTTVTYGLASSPYLAIRTLLQLARDEGVRFPRASKVLLTDTFVDDIITGAPNVDQALLLQKELIALLEAGGFHLRKWSSNNPKLLDNIPSENRAISFDTQEPNFLKILGLQWSPSKDVFFYQTNVNSSECTKRSILSDIARIFDPLGFISPVTLLAKRFIQYLWINCYEWDANPPQDIVDLWQRFKSELPLLSNFQVPRYIPLDRQTFDSISIQLHGFSDASSNGIAAVVYLRVLEPNNSTSVYLVCSKTKVAPMKQTSIPRLELMAAHILSEIIKFVEETYSNSCRFESIHAWCDSTTVLSWIRSSPHLYKPFVSNRVAAIQENVSPSIWRYVPSEHNPSDAASRGQYPSDFLKNPLWLEGPTWLKFEQSKWPTIDSLSYSESSVDEERRPVSLVVSKENPFLNNLLERFSSLQKILRTVGYVLRFIDILKHKSKPQGSFTSDELDRSLMTIVKIVQALSFGQEIENLKIGKQCSKQFRKLNAFVCPEGFFRVGGRLTNSDLDFNEKHPAILPKNHRLTHLVIEDAHRKYLHPGLNTLRFLIQQRFWILSPKKAINSCLSRCIKCFRAKPRSFQPIMGDLPSFRVNKQLKPFLSVAIDYGGPFLIKCAKHRTRIILKSYICVFVCNATKAVHIELVSDLTADAFLAALRRFIARRGTCIEIISDNGTNFVAANRLLIKYFRQAVESQAITWKFNPPSSPHMGGLFEAAVKSVKSHLKRVIGNQILTFEELNTVLTQVEALLNSRPLGPISSDPNDLLPLTPGHFLTLQPLSSPPDLDLSHLTMNRLTRWQLVQRIMHDIWKRFSHEYLHTLQQRSKWHTNPPTSIAPGTLVLIKDENLPPLKWLTGRIIETHPGKDGVVRVVTLRTVNGILKRPVVKLCPFP